MNDLNKVREELIESMLNSTIVAISENRLVEEFDADGRTYQIQLIMTSDEDDFIDE